MSSSGTKQENCRAQGDGSIFLLDKLPKRFERMPVRRGDTVIREGDEWDYYYVVESGRCQVERLLGGARMVLAELKSGDAFGEEALVSQAKRNATVVVTVDGDLLRLGKKDFNELLCEPLLTRVPLEQASRKVRDGAVWLDVRYPSEYQYDMLPGAINVPLNEVRNMFALLDRTREYVVYCQSGRRSFAARRRALGLRSPSLVRQGENYVKNQYYGCLNLAPSGIR